MLFTVFILFYNLGQPAFENWDEGFYAQVTREMIRRRDPIVLYWNGETFLDKAPLQFWINTGVVTLLGLNEFSIRFVSAVSGLFVVALTLWYSHKRFGLVPTLFTWAALTLNTIFLWRARSGNLDTLATLLFSAIVFLSYSKPTLRTSIAIGILLGLLFLQKTMLLYFGVSIVVIALVYSSDPLLIRLRNLVLTLAVAFAVLTPWITMGNKVIESNFATYYFFKSSHDALRLGAQYFNLEHFQFLYYSLQRRLILPFALGVAVAIVGLKKKENALTLFAALPLIFLLSFSETHNNWYLAPAIPFWALLVGQGVSAAIAFAKKWKYEKIAIVIMLIPLLYISYKTITVNVASLMRGGANESERASAQFIGAHSKPTDVILRTDHAHPVTIYYADRKTFYDINFTEDYIHRIKLKEFDWIVGKKETVEGILKMGKENDYTGPYAIKYLNDEAIVKLCSRKPCAIE